MRGAALLLVALLVAGGALAVWAQELPPVERFQSWWPECPPQPQPPLPISWRQRITTAAQAYLAPTQKDAKAVARRLNFSSYADPSNMCGPLAVAILRDAGLVQAGQNLAAYWLLDPRENAYLLRRLFPPERFCYRHFAQGPFQVDFSAFPLHVGDFLYLYAGSWGTFEHILVVTRVDAQGRAYAVTNLNLRPEGYYVVREVLLYDPRRPGEGMFAAWADPRHALIGLTGLGGFDLWRPLPGAFGDDPAPEAASAPLPPLPPWFIRTPWGLPQPR